MYNITDGGKTSSGFTNEKNDCTVRAISIACDISYSEAHEKLKRYGRKDGGPCYNFIKFMENYISVLEMSERQPWQKSLGSLNKFLKEHPEGTYILCNRNHAFAVVNGVVHDSWKPGPKTQIKYWWRIK